MKLTTLRQIVLAPAGESEAGGESDTTGTLTQAKEAIASTARETAARIKSATTDTASRVKNEAQRVATDTKDETANRIGGYGSALHESAKSFEEQDPNIAWATHQMADKIQGMADYVRTRDLAGLKTDVENFARRHPLAFFGGLFVGGLVIGNLLKAHQPSSFQDEGATGEFDAGNPSGTTETYPEQSTTGGY